MVWCVARNYLCVCSCSGGRIAIFSAMPEVHVQMLHTQKQQQEKQQASAHFCKELRLMWEGPCGGKDVEQMVACARASARCVVSCTCTLLILRGLLRC